MSTYDAGPPETGEQAAYWARRMNDGHEPVTAAEREKFHDWLFRDDENQREYTRYITLLSMVADLPATNRDRLITPPQSTPADRIAGRRNILKFAGIAASAAVAIVAGGLYFESRGYLGETHVTRTGEMRTVKFSEGSVAYLNTRTELRWLGSEENRRVELIAGEALFDVAHDENRPFSVVLDGSEIRVLGTRFNVYRKDTGDVTVTVLEGMVEVRGFGKGASSPQWVRRVPANQTLEYRPIGLVGEPHPTDALIAVKWRSGLLQLPMEGATLQSVLDELTRYTDQRILIRDPRLADFRVSGAFSTRDVRNALQKLQTVAPIEVHESDGLFALDYRASNRERN